MLAATEHDIELTGAGLLPAKVLLARDGNRLLWNLTEAPGLKEAAHPEDAAYQHQPPGQAWTTALTDFSRGCGIYEEDIQRPETHNGYYLSSGVDATRGYLVLSPQMQMSYISGVVGAGLDGPHHNKAVWGGSVFEGAGGAIYKWDGTNKWWVLWDEHEAAGNIADLIVFKNNLIVQWESQAYFHIFTDPTNNGAVSHNAVFAAQAYRFVALRKTIYAFLQNNTVYAQEDHTIAVLANWYSFTVGDTSYDINEVLAERDVVWVWKDDGLYAIHGYSTGGEAELILSQRTSPSDGNGRIHAIWGDFIVASAGQSNRNLIAYNMETGTVHTDWHPRDRFPQVVQLHGSIHGLAAAPGTPLYMVVGNPSGVGYGFYLVEVTNRNGELIYHSKAGHAGQPSAISIEWMAGLNRPILWWFFIASPYAPGYFRFTDGRAPDQDSTYLFDLGTDLYLITSWLPGNFMDADKALFHLMSQARYLASGQTVTISYQLNNAGDGDAWTEIVTLGPTNIGWSGPHLFPAGVECRRVRFRLLLLTTLLTATPAFDKLVLHGRGGTEPLDMVQITAACIDRGQWSAKERRTRLRAFARQNKPFTLKSFNEETLVGTIVRDSLSETVQEDDKGNPQYFLSFTFLQARANVAAGATEES